MPRWILPALAVLVVPTLATPAPPSGPSPDLFDRLDLARPGLEAVRAATDRSDFPAAAGALAGYFRARTTPVYAAWETERPRWKPGPDAPAKWERLMRHDIDLFNMTWNPGHPAIDWDFVPPTGDREYKWILNRHTFWASRWGPRWHPDDSLAGAYEATHDEKYAEEFADQLASWLDSSPVPLETRDLDGRFRTIETGIRLSATWPPAWCSFRDSPHFTPALKCRMLKAIAEQARYLMRHHSGGNWGDMEADGLVHAGVLFPEFKEAEAWRTQGVAWLVQSMRDYVYPDGAQKELTTSYHNVTLLNQHMAAQLLVTNGFAAPMRDVLTKMFEADLWHTRPDGTLPMWNDSDVHDFRYVLAAGADLFERDDLRYVATDGRQGEPPAETAHFFPHAGWAVFRSGWDAGARWFAIDLGPFGTGHQHEDKLSIDCFAFGRPMVVDPGRYTYGPGPFGPFFRGPFAHNIVIVDGLGQNRRAKPETWKTDAPLADAAFVTTQRYDWARGVYADGFGPKNDASVAHHRQVVFVKPDYWVIHDELKGTGDHELQALWHLAPGAKVARPQVPDGEMWKTHAGAWAAAWPDAHLGMQFVIPPEAGGPDALDVRTVEGQETPEIQGWYSREYMIKEPAPCVIVKWKTKCPATLTTVLLPSKEPMKKFVVEYVGEGDVSGVKVRRSGGRGDVILFAPAGGKHKVGAWEFEGEVGVFSW